MVGTKQVTVTARVTVTYSLAQLEAPRSGAAVAVAASALSTALLALRAATG